MRNVIITGGNSCLGLETAKKIAKASGDYRIILACRNLQKGEAAKAAIKAESGNENVEVLQLDTSSLDSVRSFARQYEESGFGSIYALLCNAGINGTSKGTTEDGFDVIFETNHLGHFLLTNLLLPYMEEDGLIFATSSDMHDSPMKKMTWEGTDAIARPDGELAGEITRYSYSKLCNLYFIYELADRLREKGSNIKANAFNPGMMKTNFAPVNKASMKLVKMSMPNRVGDLDASSTAYAQLVTEDGLVTGSGQYYDRSIETAESSELSYSVENRKELWEKSSEYCGLQ